MWEIVISGKKLYNYILANWWVLIRSRWSHFFVKYNFKLTTIPIHKNEDLPTWTLRKIMRDLDLTRNDILKAKK